MPLRTIICAILLACLLPSPLLPQNSKENADFKLAVNLYTDGLYDLAAEQLRQFIASYPSTTQGVEARFYLGLAELKLRRFDEARLTFQTFALTYQENPRAPEAWWNVGEAYAALGNERESALAFERVKVFHPKSKLAAEALFRSGTAFLAARSKEDARRVLRVILQEYPSTPAAMNARASLAGIYFEEGNLDQAQGELKRVIEGDPSPEAKAQALLLLGGIRQATGKPEQAQANFQEILTKYGETAAVPGARLQLGRLLAGSGRAKEGVEHLRKAAAASGRADSAIAREAMTELGDALVELGDYPGAVAAFERRLASARGTPEDPTRPWKIARGAAMGRNYRRSSEATHRLLLSGAPDSLKRRGMILAALNAEAQKEFSGAVDLFLQFVERYPRDPYAPEALWRGATLTDRQLHDVRKALLLNEQIVSRYASSPLLDDALFAAAREEESLKDFTLAAARYRVLLSRCPASPFAPEAAARLRDIELFEAKDKDSGLEKLALLVGDVVAQKDRATLAYRLGEIYFTDLKNYDAAAAQFQNAVALGLPPQTAREAHFRRAKGLEYLSMRDPARMGEAINAYTEFLAADSIRDRMAVEAAEALFLLRARSVPGAREAAAELARRIPGFPERDLIRFRLGVLLEEGDSTRGAIAQFQRFLADARTSPLAPEATARLFSLLAAGGGSDSLLALGRKGLRDYPRDPAAPRTASALGRMAQRMGRGSVAAEMFQLILDEYFYTPEASSARRALADALSAQGDYEPALALYRGEADRLREDPFSDGSPDISLLLATGRAEFLAGRPDEARKTLFSLLMRERTGERAASAYTTLGEIARAAGEGEEAAEFFRQASASDPRALPTPEIADLLFANGDHAGAIRIYERLLQTAQNDSARRKYSTRMILARLRLGDLAKGEKEIAAFAGRYKDAREELASFEVERGNHYFRQQQFAQALPVFQNTAKKFEGTAAAIDARYRIGLCLEAMEKPKEAMDQLARLVKDHPHAPIIPRARFALGNLAYGLEKWDEAVKNYRTIVEDTATDADLLPLAMSNLIATYKIAGAHDAALALTRTYLQRFPNREDQLDKKITIGILYQRLGYFDQAVLHFQSLLDEAGSDLEGELRYYIAEANFSKGDYQQAILDFLKVPYLVTKKGKFDWTANALYMSGQAYEKMGRFDQALTMYQQILDRSGIDEMFRSAARKEIDRVKLVMKKGSK